MEIRVCYICKETFNTRDKIECCGISVLHPISILKNVLINVTVKVAKDKNDKIKSRLIARVTERRGRKKKIKETVVKKERAKKKEKKIDQWIRDKVAKRDGGRCVVCKSQEGLHLHHITHRKNGGTDDPDNLKTLCELCHAEEHRDEPVYNIMIQRLFQYKAI